MDAVREPCVAGLFSEEGGARLHGARCRSCGTPYFPAPAHCRNPDCAESMLEPSAFGGRGTLWSWSVANFAPPPPHRFDAPFRPYAIGVVDLDEGLRVVGQMVGEVGGDDVGGDDVGEDDVGGGDVGQIKVGARVELVVDPIFHEDGKAVTSWKFRLV